MLDFKIDGVSADYPDNISLTLSIETPFLSDDESVPVPFTTPINFSKTPKNLKLFDFPNRWNNVTDSYREFKCEIFFAGISLCKGLFTISEVEETINGNFNGSLLLNQSKEKCNTLDLDKIFLGYADNVNEGDPRPGQQFEEEGYRYGGLYKSLNNFIDQSILDEKVNSIPANIVFSPIRITSNDYIEDEDRVKDKYFQRLRFMFMNSFVPDHGYLLQKAGHYNLFGSLMPGIRIGYFFEKVFNGQLRNNVFLHGEMRDLIIQTLYHPSIDKKFKGYPHLEVGSYNPNNGNRLGWNWERFYNPALFLPDMPRIDVVKEVLKIFCMSLYAAKGTFVMLNNSDIVASTEVINLNIYDPIIMRVSKEKGKIYKYGYSDHENAVPSYFGTLHSPMNVKRGDSSFMEDYSIRVSPIEQYILGKASTSYTQKADYEIVNGGWGGTIDEPESGDEYKDMVSNICPLNNSFHNVWWGPEENSNPIGEYPNTDYHSLYIPEVSDYAEKSDFPKILIWRGFQKIKTQSERLEGIDSYKEYPYASGKIEGPENEIFGELTLDFDKEGKGLFDRFHKAFAAWTNKDKIVGEVRMTGTPEFISNFKPYKKYQILDKTFFIRELNVEIRKDYLGPISLDVVEAVCPFDEQPE